MKNSFRHAGQGEDGRDAQWERHVEKKFSLLEGEIPEYVSGSEVVALGSFGLVVDHHDGTVSKIMLRPESEQGMQKARAVYTDEVGVLKRLQGRVFATARTPDVHREAELPQSDHAFALYRMDKCEDEEIHWESFVAGADKRAIERHFRNVGAVLASFHEQGKALLADVVPQQKEIDYGARVMPVSGFDQDVNEALARCDRYLREHIVPGVNHGDFHPWNFRVNDDDEITGLFDMGYAGQGANALYDFAMIPDAGLDYAIDEYEKRSGAKIDRDLLTITQISHDAAVINWHQGHRNGDPEIIAAHSQSLMERLHSLYRVTGMSFEAHPLIMGY